MKFLSFKIISKFKMPKTYVIRTHIKTFGIFLAVGLGDTFVLDGFKDPWHVGDQGQSHAGMAV